MRSLYVPLSICLKSSRDEQFIIALTFKEFKPKWKGLGKHKSLCFYTIVLNMNPQSTIKVSTVLGDGPLHFTKRRHPKAGSVKRFREPPQSK